jgi:hypothetical protein
MGEPARVEAVFVASSNPLADSRFYTEALGFGPPGITEDGQYTFTGSGVFFAIEPLLDAPGATDGEVTVWYRVDDVPAVVERLVTAGALVLQPPSDAGDETVAVVRTPGRQRLGFIGTRTP